MTTFVLVPGACHGGWWYAPLVDRLAAAGHRAVAVTLDGLDPAAPFATHSITLDDHVRQGARVLDGVPGDDVVLVGHSYGGSVVSGMADRHPERVRALVYLDAFVPEDGDSAWTMTDDDQRAWYVDGAGRTGTAVDPLPFFDERARPHPLATLLQRSTLTGAWRSVPTKVYVQATDWPGHSPLEATAAKVRADPEFRVLSWDTRHNVLHDGPDRVFDLLTAL